MSILDNIGDNLDKQHENHNFLPQKIELEDIDLGVRDFFEGLNITMMDQSGRQRRVPIIWLNQELFAQRKNYWEGLTNENGEEIQRPFIAIARRGIKQGTAPNKRTIPWMKKFGFTRPRTFDGTLMGYDKYMVRQATWVDCDYEIRLVTSYMVDVNVFYQDVLRDGFSDGQGYMDINGHQIRSILGEPSEDNQVSSIDDERVFQITAPLVVHGKLFDPADHEKKTTINKVVVKMCEDGNESQGVTRTFGGQSSARPFRDSCDPVNIYNHNNFLMSSVAAGQSYTVSASTVLSVSGATLATLAPGESYTIPSGGIATVLDSTGGTLTTIAAGASGVITDATIFNATGGTVGTVTAQGAFLAPNAIVFDYSGGTIANLAPNGTYQVPGSIINWSSGDTITNIGPGVTYVSSAVTILNHTGGTVWNDIEQGQIRTLLPGVVQDYSGGTLSTLAPSGIFIFSGDSATVFITNSDGSYTGNTVAPQVHTIPDITIQNTSGQTVETHPAASDYVIDDVVHTNSTGGTLPLFDGVYYSNKIMIAPDVAFENSTGGTLPGIQGILPSGGTINIPQFSIINQDGQSGSTFAYNNEVYTNFSAGTSLTASGITYKPPFPTQTTSYRTGDVGWHNSGGTYAYTPPEYPVSYARLDSSSNFPYRLIDDNAFGNKYRFTTDSGEPASDLDAYFRINTFSASTLWYVIDHLTGLGWMATKIGMTQTWNDAIDSAHTLSYSGYSDFRVCAGEEIYSVINSHYNYYAQENIFDRNDATFAAGSSNYMRVGNTDMLISSNNTFQYTNAGDYKRANKTTTLFFATYACRNHYV